MPSRRFELQQGAMRLTAWLLALAGVLALLLTTGSSLAVVPCHQTMPGAAAAHGAMQDPANHPVAEPAMMGAASATHVSQPCAGHAPDAPCCTTAFCNMGGWLMSPSPPCPMPAGALLASGHTPPAAGGPGAPFAPDLPPPRWA